MYKVQPTWCSWIVCFPIYVTHIAYEADHPSSQGRFSYQYSVSDVCSAIGLHGIHLYVISKHFYNSETMIDVSIIRVRVWKKLSWAANFVDNAIVPDIPL